MYQPTRKKFCYYTYSLWFLIWCALILPLTADTELKKKEKPPRCLIDYPEVVPRIYPSYIKRKIFLTIDVSPRITHQLSTNLFVIFLDEVLGYERVVINEYDDQFQLEDAIERLSDMQAPNTISRSQINLELWISPDIDTVDIENLRLVKDNGNSLPPGRFGWFVNSDLSHPIKNHNNNWADDITEFHWSLLRDRKAVKAFDIDDKVHLKMIDQYSRIQPHLNEFYCNDKSICKNGMYIPNQCKRGASCVLLLSSYYNETKFVIDHINELNLYAKVVWLGRNLKFVYKTLLNDYKNNRNYQKSFMVLYYYPSDLFLHQNNLISVAFKTCQLLNSTNTIGCKYELNRLVKFSWSKLQNVDKPLQAALRNFRLTEEDFVKLIKIYETHQDDKSYREMACMWMRENSNIWKTWKIGSDRFIYIGGIFPLTGSTYHGAGIIRGALLAKDIINENRTILPDYKLVISVSDGKCRADNVMKSFIDYIVDSYYHQLIGVLGPACSETVEPLAGVSKHFKILIISYSAEGASYSDKEKYPYFFRTIGENNNYMHVYLNFFKRMGWARIASLTEDGQRYTEYISHMQNLLEENQISFISNTKFPRERKHSIIIMRRYLEDLKKKRARIIIVDVYDHIARTVMCEAFHLQMTPSNGYVWFLPTWLNTSWYDVDYYKTEFKEEINCSTIDIIKVVNGYFSMTHVYYAPDNTEIVGNLSVAEWKRRYKEKSTNVAKEGTSNYAGFAYDAVWVYALALDKLTRMDPEALSDLHSTNTTKKLVKLVEETDFMGVSGRIKFHGGPSRFSVINIMQWYNNETHIIGQFTPNLTGNKPIIFGGHLQLNTSSIKWFTKDGKKPGDGMLPPLVCTLESLAKFFGTNCETAFIILDVMIGLLLLFIVVVAIVFIKKRYDKKVKNTRDYLRQLGIDFNPANFDGLDKWEIKRECVIINRKLGEGAFGTVYGGEADLPDKGWIPVAVKTLKPGSSCDDKLSFLSEAEVMKRFNHENIVRLLGVCMKDEPIYTIMEYMLYGDLKTYLLARRHLANDEDSEVSSAKLTGMALDVAKALYYLAQLNFVHRDVASRNCLVNTHRVVKLGDFGMTRAMVESDYYKFTRKGMLPVRWMPPESLREGKFSPASDIWSFGVLIYEIITFGSFPFQGYSNQQVLELVKKGKTITIPLGISSRLKGLLKLCWDRDPANRITASALVEELTNNPRLLSACTHLPRSFTQIDNIDKVEVRTPNDSLSRNHSTIPNGIGIGHEIHYDPRSVPDSGIDLSSDISRQPLLERTKFVDISSLAGPSNEDDDDNDNDEDDDNEEDDDVDDEGDDDDYPAKYADTSV